MIILVQQLRDLAGRASRGPWKSAEKDNWRGRAILAQRSEGYLFRAFAFCRSDQRVPGAAELDIANSEFIAAANPITVLALLDEIERLKAENAELIDLMRRVVAEHPRRSHKNDGNGPGHGHAIPGVWDSDNGELAGKPCAWCSIWTAAKGIVERHELAMTKEQQP